MQFYACVGEVLCLCFRWLIKYAVLFLLQMANQVISYYLVYWLHKPGAIYCISSCGSGTWLFFVDQTWRVVSNCSLVQSTLVCSVVHSDNLIVVLCRACCCWFSCSFRESDCCFVHNLFVVLFIQNFWVCLFCLLCRICLFCCSFRNFSLFVMMFIQNFSACLSVVSFRIIRGDKCLLFIQNFQSKSCSVSLVKLQSE